MNIIYPAVVCVEGRFILLVVVSVDNIGRGVGRGLFQGGDLGLQLGDLSVTFCKRSFNGCEVGDRHRGHIVGNGYALGAQGGREERELF